MKVVEELNLVSIDMDEPVWYHFYTVAPLIVIGTKEGDNYNLAPKHMATPLGHGNYFGFVCTPAHNTWNNIKQYKEFTVTYPRPNQVTLASLTAVPRDNQAGGSKSIIQSLPTMPARKVDALFLKDGYLFLECTLDRIVEGFDEFGLIAGKVQAAYISPDSMRVSDGNDGILIREAPLLAYLAYGRFAKIDESFAFPFPKGFETT